MGHHVRELVRRPEQEGRREVAIGSVGGAAKTAPHRRQAPFRQGDSRSHRLWSVNSFTRSALARCAAVFSRNSSQPRLQLIVLFELVAFQHVQPRKPFLTARGQLLSPRSRSLPSKPQGPEFLVERGVVHAQVSDPRAAARPAYSPRSSQRPTPAPRTVRGEDVLNDLRVAERPSA